MDSLIKAVEFERRREWTPTEVKYFDFRIDQVKDLLNKRGVSSAIFMKDIKEIIEPNLDSLTEYDKKQKQRPRL